MSEGNLGGEAAIIEERRKKLKALRENAKAYINDFDRLNRAADIIDQYNDC